MANAQNLKDKVTTSQLIMTYIAMSLSPIVRFLPTFAASQNTEAVWLSPLVSLLPLGILILILGNIFRKYKNHGLGIIIEDILGKYMGKFIIFINLLWLFFLNAYFIRGSAERIASSIYPNININFSMILGLLFLSYILHFSSTTIVRMGQILFPIFVIIIIFITLFLLPKVRPDAIFPISINDSLPIFKASIGILSEFSFIFIFFFFSENIMEKEKIKSIMAKNLLIAISIAMALLITTIGVLGYSVTARSPVPYLSAIKQISFLDTIENIEAVIVAVWVLADTLLFSSLVIICLKMIKHLFKVNETKNLINIFIMLLYIAALGICNNRMELDIFGARVLVYINLFLGYFTPVLLFTVGKIRRKL